MGETRAKGQGLEIVKAGQVQSLRGSGSPQKNGIVWIRI